MKALIVTATLSLVLASFTGQAVAGCAAAPPVTRVSNTTALQNLLSGKIVCVPAVTVDPMTWQEEHRAGGELWDYKRGPADSVDPSEQVGTWVVSGDPAAPTTRAVVTHQYTGGPSYTYTVFDNGNGTHSFCKGGVDITATIKVSGGGC